MTVKITCDIKCGVELAVGTVSRGAFGQDLILNGIEGRDKREKEKYHNNKKRNSLLHHSFHIRIIRRENIIVKPFSESELLTINVTQLNFQIFR